MITQSPIRHFETIDSTNLEAARLASSGEPGPLWLLADEQHAGKGRLGRQWLSEPGNLYVTLLFTTEAAIATIPQLSFVTALAVHDTVQHHAPNQTVQLKWPNDSLLNGGKVAGILCENLGHDGKWQRVAIGCGINITHSPQNLAYKTSHIGNTTVEAVFKTYRENLQSRLTQWSNGTGFPSIIDDWQTKAANLNQPITINSKQGIFRGLASDGALRLEKADGTEELLYAGDVSLVLRGLASQGTSG